MKRSSIIILVLLSVYLCQGQETGTLSGTLNDRLTGDPLFAVKVTAGGQVTRTDDDGMFNLNLSAGSFDIRFNRYGLETMIITGVIMTEGDTVLIDTSLMPEVVPVAGVYANDEVSWLEVTWVPSGPCIQEKSNDDGGFDDIFVYQEAGSQVAVKFENNYDHIIGGRIFTGDGTFPGPFLGTDFLVRVYDDEGMNGLPGNTLDEDTVKVYQYGWVGFDSLDALTLTDNYYLDMVQLHDAPGCAPVGCTQYPANNISLMKLEDYNWYPFPSGNAMIRPWVTTPHDSLRVMNYRVGRLTNFDPNGHPSAGTLSELATTGNCYYHDYAWGGLTSGCVAYCIKALYNNGLYSPVAYSNIIFKPPSVDVSIIINNLDDVAPWSAYVKLAGQSLPFKNYSGIVTSSDTVKFNGIFMGTYRLEMFKPGCDKFIQDSLIIQSDTLFEFSLQENLYPVENLRVHPFTGFVEWENSFLNQFVWQCDTPSTCHLLTTPELNLLCGNWTLTVSYNYNSGDEPATVDYSTDHGRTWAPFYQFVPQPSPDTVDIDLSALIGETEIMFQVHDLYAEPYYLSLDEVRIWTPDIKSHPEYCLISLDGEPAGSSDTTCFNLNSLENGKSYRIGLNAIYSTIPSDTVFTEFTYHQLFPPENFEVIEDGDSLRFSWSPPSGSWDSGKAIHGYPDALTGYILKYELNNTSHEFTINDPLDTTYILVRPNCDTASITLTAVYDLSDYGYPGTSLESLPAGPLVLIGHGPFDNEFIEDWSGMSFFHNCWQVEGYGFAINAYQGFPGPALVFQNPAPVIQYQVFLNSYPIFIRQTIDGNLTLEFDLNLVTSGQSGYEILEFQVLSEGTSDWIMVQGISNLLGNINWQHFTVDLTGFVTTDLFQLRLKFEGIGANQVRWMVDNIHVYNHCEGPKVLQAELSGESIVNLNWTGTGESMKVKGFTGFRIYRDYNEEGYALLAETTDTVFTDLVSNGGKYCYKVTAVYNDQGIECESPESDSACIISTLGIQDNIVKNKVVCYPNPARNFIMIKSEEEMQKITLYNFTGANIKTIGKAGYYLKVDLNEYPSGIYMIGIELFNEVLYEKFVH